jgi:hypothetical protein
MSDTYSLYAVAVGSSVIRQITDQRVDPGIMEMLVSGDGTIDNEHASIVGIRPILRFTTSGISQALNIAGVSGLVIDQAGSSNGVDLYFAKRAMGSGFASGSVHIKLEVDLGLLYPVSLRATHEANDPATIEYGLAAVGVDAANAPLSCAKGQSLGALAPAISEVYTVGPWWVNGTQVASVQEFGVDFGLEVASPSGSGAVWPTSAFFRRRAAGMTCTSHDLPILDDTAGISIQGKARSGVTRAFLTQKKQGVANWADAEAKHIKFELAEGRINPDPFGGAHQDDALAALRVTSTWNGANAPIAYTNNVAISGS